MPSIRYCTVDRTEHHEDTVYVSWFSTHTFPPYKWCTAAPALFLHQAEPTRACTTTELPPQLRPHWLPYCFVSWTAHCEDSLWIGTQFPLYSSPPPPPICIFSLLSGLCGAGNPGGLRPGVVECNLSPALPSQYNPFISTR